jgi:thiamine biosynthesis lipoprotein ApbE
MVSSRRNYELPSPEAIQKAKQAFGYQHIKLNSQRKIGSTFTTGMQ